MEITYYVNGSMASKKEAEWYFGKKFVKNTTEAAKLLSEVTKQREFKNWQDGTGYLTIKTN